MRDDKERLLDILEAIVLIEKYAVRGKASFEQDELLQTWMVHYLEVIGEAVARLSDELRDGHPEVPWSKMIAMRNILVHVYFKVSLDEVWATVDRDVPVLKKQISSILNNSL